MIRPFFYYYGGKWRDARKHYPPPEHPAIVEPFAGAAGYSLRYADRAVTLCEIDPVVAGVWRYLLRVSAAEILAIPDIPEGGGVDDLGLCQEAAWLVGFWLNHGASSPRKTPSAWMRSGVRPGSFWGERVRETIAAQLEQVRHWRIIECDYRDAPSMRATWFIDPPYEAAGKHYRCGSKGINYAELGEWCKSRPGQVIVCEGPGATWLPFEAIGAVKTCRAKSPAVESAWFSSGEIVRPQLSLFAVEAAE